MYLSGKGCTIIARELNEENIIAPAKYKKEVLKTNYAWDVGKGLWTTSTVAGILKNPVYTGAIVLRKFDKPSYKLKYRKQISLEEKELIEDAHEAIISKEDFEQAQRMREKNRVPYFDKNKESHKYAGLLYCGKCKTVMRKRYLSSQEAYDGYMCGFHQKMGNQYCELNHITFEKLDELVVFAVGQQLKYVREELKSLEQEYLKVKSDNTSKVVLLETKMSRNREYQKKAYEQFMDEILTKIDYLELKQMYEKENEQYQKEVFNLKKEENEKQKIVDEAMKWLGRFSQKKITMKQLSRDVLVELIDKIYVYPEQQIDIYFNFENPKMETEKGVQ